MPVAKQHHPQQQRRLIHGRIAGINFPPRNWEQQRKAGIAISAAVEKINHRAVIAKGIVRRNRLDGENQQQNPPQQHHGQDKQRWALEKFHRANLVEVLPAAKLFRQHTVGMADTPNVPLVVDLDGTLIRTDLMWELLARCLRRNPFAIFPILFWWARGRARLKQQLATRVQFDPGVLPYHERFLDWLRQEKASGRTLVLATASDLGMAQPVADHLGLFTEILASDGKTNLRWENKRRALVRKFGERGFDYAGNSQDDLVVWRSARRAIVVNASASVQRQAAGCAEPGPSFCDGFSALAVARSFATELFWRSGYLLAAAAGLLLALAFPKFSIAGFAWIAPALMLAAAHGKSGGGRFSDWLRQRTGVLAGFALLAVADAGHRFSDSRLAGAGRVCGALFWRVGGAGYPQPRARLDWWIKLQQSTNPPIQ